MADEENEAIKKITEKVVKDIENRAYSGVMEDLDLQAQIDPSAKMSCFEKLDLIKQRKIDLTRQN